MYTVKVLYVDSKRAERLSSDGSTTIRRIHAVMIPDKDRAERVASEIVRDNSAVVSRAWVERF